MQHFILKKCNKLNMNYKEYHRPLLKSILICFIKHHINFQVRLHKLNYKIISVNLTFYLLKKNYLWKCLSKFPIMNQSKLTYQSEIASQYIIIEYR